MRTRFALLALALAFAAAPLAAKPVAVDDGSDSAREHWRGQGVSLCVGELNRVRDISPEDSETICGCAFDQYMPGRPTGALPALDPLRLRTELGAPIVRCTIEREPRRAEAVGHWLATIPALIPPVAVAPPPPAPPPDDGGKPKADDEAAAQGPGFDPGAWFEGLHWPRWLSGSGLPLWAWIPIIIIGVLVLRGIFGRESGRDLIGPPPRR